ncbi:MAG: hypothetical protein ACMXYC_03475 [Candidatus Woesearchaeota archaeon]
MKVNKWAQVSMEYLIIIGIASLIIIPSLYLFYRHNQETTFVVSTARAGVLGNEIIKESQQLYFMGREARNTISFNMPDHVHNISIYNRSELIISLSIRGKQHDLVYDTQNIPLAFAYNCTDVGHYTSFVHAGFDEGILRPGDKRFVLQSCGDVLILRP